jgi:hypothetical protein
MIQATASPGHAAGRRLAACGLALAMAASPLALRAEGEGGDGGARPGGEGFRFDAHVKLEARAEEAIARAQAWLASVQRPDGSWDTPHGRDNTGVIAYAILALMVNGSVPGEGRHGREIGLGLQFLLNKQTETGLICSGPQAHAPMYQHALSTVTLAEAYGMTLNPRLRTALIKAVGLIVETQHSEGGWRYQPRVERGDISASVMQVMALRAAAESGIQVPEETLDRAIRFIRKCYNPKEKGFGYMHGGESPKFARSAAGLVCLQTVGLFDDPIIPEVVDYVLRHTDDLKADHYWYGHYYASIGLYHYGGEPWKTYYPRIKEKILKDWERECRYGSNVLDTSWAVLILGVPYRYLPIYQR